MRRYLVALFFVFVLHNAAVAQGSNIVGGGIIGDAKLPGYTGPGDVVGNWRMWWGLRGFSAAYSTGSNNAATLRRQSDSTTQNIVILKDGSFDMDSANTFAGTDATCQGSTTGLSTTIAFTGCSSTPNANDPVFGAGITQPAYLVSCGAFVAGAGTCTLNAAQNIAIAETVTMQVALFVTKLFDQSGQTNCTAAACDLIQATTTNQPLILPSCQDNLPCMAFNGTTMVLTAASLTTKTQPYTYVAVALRTGNTGGFNTMINSINTNMSFYNASGTANAFANSGSNICGSSVSGLTEAAWYVGQAVFNGASSTFHMDNTANPKTCTPQNPGAASMTTSVQLGDNGSNFLIGRMVEAGVSTNAYNSSLSTNIESYWGDF